jgi:hypothetical protein
MQPTERQNSFLDSSKTANLCKPKFLIWLCCMIQCQDFTLARTTDEEHNSSSSLLTAHQNDCTVRNPVLAHFSLFSPRASKFWREIQNFDHVPSHQTYTYTRSRPTDRPTFASNNQTTQSHDHDEAYLCCSTPMCPVRCSNPHQTP